VFGNQKTDFSGTFLTKRILDVERYRELHKRRFSYVLGSLVLIIWVSWRRAEPYNEAKEVTSKIVKTKSVNFV